MIYSEEIFTDSAEATFSAGKAFAERISHTCGVMFYGEMGAGKTCFIQGMAAGLGVKTPVTSPTFAIVSEYSGYKTDLFHFDLFRVNGEDDLFAVGFYDYLTRGGIFVVEWSENAPEIAGEFAELYRIHMTKIDTNKRKIMITGGDTC